MTAPAWVGSMQQACMSTGCQCLQTARWPPKHGCLSQDRLSRALVGLQCVGGPLGAVHASVSTATVPWRRGLLVMPALVQEGLAAMQVSSAEPPMITVGASGAVPHLCTDPGRVQAQHACCLPRHAFGHSNGRNLPAYRHALLKCRCCSVSGSGKLCPQICRQSQSLQWMC